MTSSWERSAGGTRTSQAASADGARPLPTSSNWYSRLTREPAVLGLGYIVGLKYAAIICAGSLAVWWIIVPGISLFWGDQVLNAWNPDITTAVGDMSPELIFKEYAKSIGIGGIAMAGIIGIVRSWGIIKSAVSLAASEMKGKRPKKTWNVLRRICP